MSHHDCHCCCRQIARRSVNILKKKIPEDIPKITLSLQVMRESGATPKNLNHLYNNVHAKISYLGVDILGNFEDMIELLFTTRKSNLCNVIDNKLIEAASKHSIEYGTLVNRIGNAEQIVQFLWENNYRPRYSPGILYSLYSWGKRCECCQRHKRNFPIF